MTKQKAMTRASQMAIAALGFLVFVTGATEAHAESCASLSDQGEGLMAGRQFQQAEPILLKAVEACRKDKTRGARPFIALGTAYFNTGRAAKAIPLFEEALKMEPGLPLAYMNLTSAYIESNNLEKAIEVGEGALKKNGIDDTTKGKINFNVGLAYFKKAANASDTKDMRSEAYFKKAAALYPSFGGSDFYLGVISEAMRSDYDTAANYYKSSCQKGYQQACRSQETVNQNKEDAVRRAVVEAREAEDQKQADLKAQKEKEEYDRRMAAADERDAEEARQAAAEEAEREKVVDPVPNAKSEMTTFQKYEKAWMKKGRSPAEARKKANQMWRSSESMTPDQRKAFVEQTLEHMEKQ